tara:strand:+ start:535 stop:714 length:180 start_codon:yes stop_codon:yes gene_type:complete
MTKLNGLTNKEISEDLKISIKKSINKNGLYYEKENNFRLRLSLLYLEKRILDRKLSLIW